MVEREDVRECGMPETPERKVVLPVALGGGAPGFGPP